MLVDRESKQSINEEYVLLLQKYFEIAYMNILEYFHHHPLFFRIYYVISNLIIPIQIYVEQMKILTAL